jgi:amino acid transporter
MVFCLANTCVIRMRRAPAQHRDDRYRMPLAPTLPLIAITVQIGLAAFVFRVSPPAWGIVLAWCALGAHQLLRPGKTRLRGA